MCQPDIPIRLIAHGRAGDKGNHLNVSLIAHNPKHFDHLCKYVTEAFCAEVFSDYAPSSVERYPAPTLGAMNFVLYDILDGGVNLSLRLDRHGKSLSFLLLDSRMPAPEGWVA